MATELKSAAELVMKKDLHLVYGRNEIPPMTNEMGAYWKQPARSEILIDDTHAVMSRASFERLSNYECSDPTGVYHGKMWRRGMRLVWFGHHANPELCSNNYREILIAEP